MASELTNERVNLPPLAAAALFVPGLSRGRRRGLSRGRLSYIVLLFLLALSCACPELVEAVEGLSRGRLSYIVLVFLLSRGRLSYIVLLWSRRRRRGAPAYPHGA